MNKAPQPAGQSPASAPAQVEAGLGGTAVKVRSSDTGEWLPTKYVPRGSNRHY
ncbi:MAG: hypothetical protein ACT4OM_04350 [Actinomycetota bacterium]